jgi:hypothetical protein
MDQRRTIAEALTEHLFAHGLEFRAVAQRYPVGAAELELAVPRASLGRVPRAMARFAQELDLRLVHLGRPEIGRWRAVLAWADDVGRPWFIAADFMSDYWRGARRFLACEQLLAGTSDIRFLQGLVDAVELGVLDGDRGEYLAGLYEADPRGAEEGIERFWRRPVEARGLIHAARRADWSGVRAALSALRRSLHRSVRPRLAALAGRPLVERWLHPVGARIAFLGREGGLRTSLMRQVERDLAPLGLTIFEEGLGDRRRADLHVVFDAPPGAVRESDDVAAIRRGDLPAMAAQAAHAILRWLEGRVERRHPAAMVGDNPPRARLVQYAARQPLLGFIPVLFHCDIACRLRSPLVMPHPYGIVIDEESRIGSRVTVMNHVTISAAVIEDNVVIGPGARVIGPLTIGRGATIGPNAVVTEDVPSHSTVTAFGDGSHESGVAEKRHQIHSPS